MAKNIPRNSAVILESNGSIKNATAPAENFVYYEPVIPGFGPINPIYKRRRFLDEIK